MNVANWQTLKMFQVLRLGQGSTWQVPDRGSTFRKDDCSGTKVGPTLNWRPPAHPEILAARLLLGFLLNHLLGSSSSSQQ